MAEWAPSISAPATPSYRPPNVSLLQFETHTGHFCVAFVRWLTRAKHKTTAENGCRQENHIKSKTEAMRNTADGLTSQHDGSAPPCRGRLSVAELTGRQVTGRPAD